MMLIDAQKTRPPVLALTRKHLPSDAWALIPRYVRVLRLTHAKGIDFDMSKVTGFNFMHELYVDGLKGSVDLSAVGPEMRLTMLTATDFEGTLDGRCPNQLRLLAFTGPKAMLGSHFNLQQAMETLNWLDLNCGGCTDDAPRACAVRIRSTNWPMTGLVLDVPGMHITLDLPWATSSLTRLTVGHMVSPVAHPR
jgi:hypothetical protein